MKYRGKAAINPHGQKGAALLAFMLIMITGASFMLISKMNKERIDRENITETYRALERAKQALIGFALTLPERSTASPRPGPGYLPCPDSDNDGTAELACGGGGVVSTGRIPYRTLEEDVLVDDSGQVLWYALSPEYRNIGARFTPLNSDTVGQISLDGQGDIIALIIAPGPALAEQGQDRAADFNDISNYLEDDNQNGNNSFISSLPGADSSTFNDRVLALTRQDLMGTVEKRVLGEVDIALSKYRDSLVGNEAYPWLSPFTNPVVSAFSEVPGTKAGHFGVHIVGQSYTNSAVFNVDWSGLTGGSIDTTGTAPTEDCLRNSTCTSQYGAFDASVGISGATCNWRNRLSFDCVISINDIWPVQLPGVNRTYRLEYTDDSTNIGTVPVLTTTPPTISLTRTRSISISGQFRGELRITITDSGAQEGSATLIMDPQSDTVGGDINLAGMDYYVDATAVDLDGDGDINGIDEKAELPDWFTINDWHHLIYVAYPESEDVPGNNSDVCTSGPAGDCLKLDANGNPVQFDIRALAMIAGNDLVDVPLPEPGPRPNGSLEDYFEGENSDLDPVYNRQHLSDTFNDQIRVINP